MSRCLHRTLVAWAIADPRKPRLDVGTVALTDIVERLHRAEREVHHDVGGCKLGSGEVGRLRQAIFDHPQVVIKSFAKGRQEWRIAARSCGHPCDPVQADLRHQTAVRIVEPVQVVGILW
ncbi:MAG TPA: hypothetical protein V6D09_13560 [Leptolyngbyaceae cyanobacterium]